MTASGCASEDPPTVPTVRAGALPLPARNKPAADPRDTPGTPLPPSQAAVAAAVQLPEEPSRPAAVVAALDTALAALSAEPRPLPLPASIHNSCKTCSPACCRRRSVGKT